MGDNGLGPSGIDTVSMSEELCRMKGDKYKFAYYDFEDIQQEIWIAVNKASGKYDPERTKNPKTFFNVVTNNALKNLRRDTRIIDNVNLPNNLLDRADDSFKKDSEECDLYDYMCDNMPDNLKEAFKRMAYYGGEGVSQYIKTKVRSVVLRLLEKYRDE